ncbi:hypothetical protein N2W54_004160 [Lotmaria passim]
MENSEPKPHILALRRFLISSSSSSSSAASSPARRAAAAKKAAKRTTENTSSVSTDASATSSSATSPRHCSHHSTPPQTRLQYTAEKALPASPSPDAQDAAAVPRRRSQSSDSAESRDYVDAIASSAFHDCRNATTRSLFSTQHVLSFTGASPAPATAVVMKGAGAEPSPLLGGNLDAEKAEKQADEQGEAAPEERYEFDENDICVEDDGDGEADVEAAEEAATLFSPVTVNDDAVDALERENDGGQPATGVAGEEEANAAGEAQELADDVAPQNDRLPPSFVTADADAGAAVAVGAADQQPESPPLTFLVHPPLSHSPTQRAETQSSDTTSSSRHQVGVWKAIYGKERWGKPRQGCLGVEEDVSEGITATNTEEPNQSFLNAVAAPPGIESHTAPPSHDPPAGTSRHSDSSQWAATRKTALEVLRAQLDSSESHTASAGEQRNRRKKLPISSVTPSSRSADWMEEPTIIDAVIQEAGEEDKEDKELEEPFQVMEEQQTRQPPVLQVNAEVELPLPQCASAAVSSEARTAAVTTAQPKSPRRLAAATQRQRQTAEGVLEQLFSGAFTAPCIDLSHPEGTDSHVTTSPLQSSHLVIRPTLSAEVSRISPIKNEAPSILAELYDTPEVGRARSARTPVEAAVTRAVGTAVTTALTSPSSPDDKDGRQRRRSGFSSESRRDEATLDLSAMDFRTAQTAPTTSSASSSVLSDAAMRPGELYEAVHYGQPAAPHPQRPRQLEQAYQYNDAEVNVRQRQRQLLGGEDSTMQPRSASALRIDSRVSVFPATAPNAWDVAHASKWRSKEQQEAQQQTQEQAQQQTQDTSGTAAGAVAPTPSAGLLDANQSPTIAQKESNIGSAAALRQQRVRQEMRAKELAECTFHPTLSPGTRAMVRMAQQREIEKTLLDTTPPLPPARAGASSASKAATATQALPAAASTRTPTPPLDPRTLKATLQNVYERLYPAELSAAASRRQILDQEMEYRRLAREELILLRRRAGVVMRRAPRSHGGATHGRDTFETFMSNILQTDWEQATSGRSAGVGGGCAAPLHAGAGNAAAGEQVAVVETPYMSPMAIALLEEREVKRRYRTRREAEMQQTQHSQDSQKTKAGPATSAAATAAAAAAKGETSTAAGQASPESVPAEETFRIALFDEFLLRQNAYYFNRARAVRDLERKLTPDFTPTTTHMSARLVETMVSRSLMNESMGPETSSLITQRRRQHIPIPSSSFIPQHHSPYRDPCTFQPQLSPATRAAKAAERQQQQRQASASKTSASAHRKAFFDRLYGDHDRIKKERARAAEAIVAAEMAGVTFTPQLNGSRNAEVKSVLNPRNFEQYQQYLRKKRDSQDEERQARLNQSQKSEEVVCTFRPQTTKTPAYISKMAKSFGVLRHQDTSF